MPTPEDDTATVLPTPPIEASSSRASFASCPPEEEREPHAPREARLETPQILDTSGVRSSAHETTGEDMPEPRIQMNTSQIDTGREELEKGEHIEDASPGNVAESPSPVGSPETSSDGDLRLAGSMATAALAGASDVETKPRYLFYPPLNTNRVC